MGKAEGTCTETEISVDGIRMTNENLLMDKLDSSEVANWLKQIDSISYRDGVHVVRLQDGRHAFIDLSGEEPQISMEGDLDKAAMAAALIAAKEQHLRFNSSGASEEELRLVDLAKMLDKTTDDEPEKQRKIRIAMADRGAEIWEGQQLTGNDDLEALVAEQGLDDLVKGESEQTKMRKAEEARSDFIADEIRRMHEHNNPSGATDSQAALFGVNEDGTVNLPKQVIENQLLAQAAGQEHLIPESRFKLTRVPVLDEDGNPKLDDKGKEIFEVKQTGDIIFGDRELRYRAQMKSEILEQGKRFNILAGPPGAGKGTFAKQMASDFGLRFLQIDGGNDDFILQDYMGGASLVTKAIKRKDSDGNERIESAVVSGTSLGAIAKASVEGGWWINLDEVTDGGQVMALHELFGADMPQVDDEGNPKPMPPRRFTIPSTESDEAYEAHPSVVFSICTNDYSGLKAATQDRGGMGVYLFEEPEIDVEAERLTKRVNSMLQSVARQDLARNKGDIQKSDNFGLEHAMIEDPQTVMPFVKMIREIRTNHRQDPDGITEVGSRRPVHLLYHLIREGYRAEKEGPLSDATQGMLERLSSIIVDDENTMTVNDRLIKINEMTKDFRSDLKDIVNIGAEAKLKARKDRVAAKKKAKASK
jgi:hypothetical protein